eukprot:CAMPEP_0115015526 /NCGR_PEP_ID=MMETSP0216-20121206/26832_1 /TAXON_ID=223996 /ORGANISM="Protocruzia adherens, Strain Boccale" /LENGTH=542 /DNA_ID=CAMNT_0002385685 /DNA_START=59 /DNA_END=1683 /DNA_ORIENTATION=+
MEKLDIKKFREEFQDLRRKVERQERDIEEKDNIINAYKSGDQAAEEKIKQLNLLHSQQKKALLKSIQELKKENASLKIQNKEHKRSDLIERLKKEIQMQDKAITALRRTINDEDVADKAILQALNAGPAQFRELSMEEMKMEIKKLKAQVSKLKTGKGGLSQSGSRRGSKAGSNMGDLSIPVTPQNNRNAENSMMAGSNVGNFVSQAEIDERTEKIHDLTQENEEIKEKFRIMEDDIAKQKEIITTLHADKRELEAQKMNYKMLDTLNLALEQELEKYRVAMNEKFLLNQNAQIESSELEIERQSLADRLMAMQRKLEMERDHASTQQRELFQRNDELIDQYGKLKEDFVSERKRNTESKDVIESSEKQLDRIKEEHDAVIAKKDAEIGDLRVQIEELEESKLTEKEADQYQAEIDGLKDMIGQKDSEIDIYKAKIGDLKGQFSENQNQELATARADCQKWHSKVKELSRRELELLETIENLKQEQKKQLAQYILNKKKVAANASTAGGVNISSAYEGTDGDKTRDQLLKLDRDKGALSQKV